MILALHLLAAVAYLAGWSIDLRAFRAGDSSDSGSRRGVIVGVGVAAHLAALLVFIGVHDTLPLIGVGPASSTLAFLIGVVALLASLRPDSRPATLFLLPPVLLLLGESLVVGVEPALRQTPFRGPWFVFHVGSVFAGYAALLLASVASLMYLLQFRSLKRKRFGSVFRFFPSLDALDGLNRVGLYFGYPLFTLGIVAGWSWTLTYGRSGFGLDNPEVVLGIVTWVAYLAAILVRSLSSRRAERVALASAAACLVTAAAFVYLRLTVTPPGFFL